jgi:hypothetical protein
LIQGGSAVNDDPDNKGGTDHHADDDAPRILKAVITRNPVPCGRRDFFRQALGGAATALAAGGAVSACDSATSYDIEVDSTGRCRCHVVCTCESEGAAAQEMDAVYNGNTCTCDLVCDCDTVCTSESEGG